MNQSGEAECAPSPGPTLDWSSRHALGVLLTIFPIMTITGNSIVIISVLTHRRLRTITNVFIVSLACADFMVAFLVMPFNIYLVLTNDEWLLGRTVCYVLTSFDVMFTTNSILHLSCLAIDRYLAICRPFYHERMSVSIVAIMLAICWTVPIFISFIPIMNEWNVIGIEEHYNCVFPEHLNACIFIVNIPYSLICSAIAFYIPTVFMVICNSKIFVVARQQAMQIRSLEQAANHDRHKGKFKQETKAAKTLGIIMGCFCICWFPFFILNVIDPLIGYRIPALPWKIALWLGYINSMMNPFLYYFFNRAFKTAFRRIFLCRVCYGIKEFREESTTAVTTVSDF